jgi:hypothetical protein
MNNSAARFGLLTLNTPTLSSTGNTHFVLNDTFAVSSSTNTLQDLAPQYETLTFGTPAERKVASCPKRDLRKQRGRLKASRALQREAFQRVQSYLQNQEERKAYPPDVYALPNLTVPGPSNAMYGMVNAEFGAGYGPLGMQAHMGNAGVPPLPVFYVPQSSTDTSSMYGHNPTQQHYGEYLGPQAIDVTSDCGPPVQAAASPMQEHASQLPEDVDHHIPSISWEERQALTADLPTSS